MSTPQPDNEPRKLSFKAPRAKWIRLGIWSVITLLFAFWTRSGWWLLALPLIFDLYITRLLPWGFWRTFKNKTLRTLFDWIDAIVFALVAVYLINIYFFQNYQIPSSSLEKSRCQHQIVPRQATMGLQTRPRPGASETERYRGFQFSSRRLRPSQGNQP